MARPVNGKPAWLIERLKERPTDGVPEFVDTYLHMKYDADDIARIKAGYERKRTPVLWANPAVCTAEEAQSALDEVGIACSPHAWCPGAFTVTQEELARFFESELAAQGGIRVVDDPTALLVAELTAQAANDLADARKAQAEAQAAADAEQAAAANAQEAVADGGNDVAAEHIATASAQVGTNDSKGAVRGVERAPKVKQATADDQGKRAVDELDASALGNAADSKQQTAMCAANVADAATGNTFVAESGESQDDVAEPFAPVSVAELCAGVGTMTLPLSATTQDAVRIHACEVSSAEYERLCAALETAGATNVDAQRYDSRRFRSDEHAFDIILLDPPCTPTGTLYAHDPRLHAQFPEAKIPEYMALAKSLFLLSLSMLNVGGTLVYTTSSVLHLENEEVLRTCLARSGSMGTFEVEPVELPGNVDLPQLPTSTEDAILTCPSETCPGRFIAKIRRIA